MTEIHALQSRSDLQNWKDLENRSESDQDSRLTNLVHALSRLLGWLNDGKTCEKIGMRFTAMFSLRSARFYRGKLPQPDAAKIEAESVGTNRCMISSRFLGKT